MNRVELEGRAGKDAEIRYLPEGKAVATISLATSNDYKPKDGGDWIKRLPSWHSIVAFGRVAEALAEANKGDKLKIVGKINYRDWDDKEGKKHQTTEIIAYSVEVNTTTKAATNTATDDDVPF